ncbi:Hypothetical predicted protein, partial [Pelobates cultripes]
WPPGHAQVTSWLPHRLPSTKVVDVGKHPAHYQVYGMGQPERARAVSSAIHLRV